MIENKTQTNSRHEVVKLFMDSLARLEKEGDSGDLLRLFADNCALGNTLVSAERFQGKDGASRFWSDYRHTFNDIKSEFSRITEAENAAVLEWTSTGTLKTGTPVKYQGVTILTLDNEQIVDFMAYFDSRPLTTHLH